MKETNLSKIKKLAKADKKPVLSSFKIMLIIMAVVVVGSIIFLSVYKPSTSMPAVQMTLEQKMAQLDTPLAEKPIAPNLPWWMVAMIFAFVAIQVAPLLIASKKSHKPSLSAHQIREIEFLVETPLHLGLLGSLLGVCMTQFLTGSLAAPLAYFTTISGILLYLLGRFMILVSLPIKDDN